MRTIYDRTLRREVRVPSVRELRAEKAAAKLKELGIDPLKARCGCCGLPLTDLLKIKFSDDGPIGPKCSKHYPDEFPCRKAQQEA